MPAQTPPLDRTLSLFAKQSDPTADPPMPPPVSPPMVVAAVAVSFALIVGIVAWITTHPSKTPPSAAPLPVAIAQTEPAPRRTASEPVRDDIVPAVLPVKPHEVRVEHAVPPPPPSQPQLVRVAETPPLPKSPPPKFETYGTSVQFLGNQTQAAEMARRESKLLFVLHVSGNFEDSCFT